jgi:ureidoglycolate hydrolase
MKENLLEIHEFVGTGYQPVVDYDRWRVAILNFIDEIHPTQIKSMERHNETDEVFVLLKGSAILFVGEGEKIIEDINYEVMVSGKIYNVRRSVWHSIVISREGSVLIVENQNTTRKNSDYSAITSEQRASILEIARKEQLGWN